MIVIVSEYHWSDVLPTYAHDVHWALEFVGCAR